MAKLKPCPFCGGSAALYAAPTIWPSSPSWHQVGCLCDAWGPRCRTGNEAIAAWNRRTAERKAKEEK